MNNKLEEIIKVAKEAKPLTKEDMIRIEKEAQEFKEYISQVTRLNSEDLKKVYGPVKGQ